MTRTGSLVGRRAEIDQLLALTTSGEPAIVVGDAGVGKTRLVAEVVTRLGRDGRPVVTAACLPLAAPLPLLPIVDVLKMLFRGDVGPLCRRALESCPDYVRDELARLLPELEAAVPAPALSGQGWQQERLFSALMDFCRGVSARQQWTMIIEDVHWSDATTRDFLTYLLGHEISGMSVVMTTRRPDPDSGHEADWLRHLVSATTQTELELGPLSRQEVHELASMIRGSPLTERSLADLYRRAEGNAFFTEQLLAAQELTPTAGLPVALAQLLQARASDLQPASRRVLEALAVAARPLLEPELLQITGDELAENRRAFRDLLARQLTRTDDGLAFTTKHALLGEAVAEALLPGERAELSGAVATILLDRGEPALAGEAADHFARAGRPDKEFPARVRAAEYAETIRASATAAGEWERAMALAESAGHSARAGELALRTMVAWDYAGQTLHGEAIGQRGLIAARAAGQRHTEAALLARLAWIHHVLDKAVGRSEFRQAIDLFEGLPPSAEQVRALYLLHRSYDSTGDHRAGRPYLERAVAIGEADSRFRNELVPALINAALEYLYAGDLSRGWATHQRARTVAESLGDPYATAWLALGETDSCLKLNRLEEGARVGEQELTRLRAEGLQGAQITALVFSNTVEALFELGRVDDAERLIDRFTVESRTPETHWMVEEARSRVDLVQARLDASTTRVQTIVALGRKRGTEFKCGFGQHRAELALWQGRPDTAIEIVQSVLGVLRGTEDERFAARLLVLGMRACADVTATRGSSRPLGEQSPVRELVGALEQMAIDPFAAHDFFVTASTDGAEWRAEFKRAYGRDEPDHWEAGAVCWDGFGRPHRAAYARWRQTEAFLRNGDRRAAAACLRVAWRQADQHVPLRNALSTLARMARIDLSEPSAPVAPMSKQPTPFGLTGRELDVIRLLVDGRTNAEIGARLYMSPKTASVHVTSILRKLGATNRVHAAAMAQRTGLLDP